MVCLLILLLSFTEQKHLILTKCNLSIISFMDHGSVSHNFLLASLKTFSLVFCSFNMKWLRCRFFICLLLGVPWIFWICGLFSVSNRKNSLLSQIFPLFLSLVFWYSNHTCVTHFKIVCSSLLLCSVPFHSISLHFNLGSFYWLSSNTLISCLSVANPSKAF